MKISPWEEKGKKKRDQDVTDADQGSGLLHCREVLRYHNDGHAT